MYEISEEKFDSILSKATNIFEDLVMFRVEFLTSNGEDACMLVSKSKFNDGEKMLHICKLDIYEESYDQINLIFDGKMYDKLIEAHNMREDQLSVDNNDVRSILNNL